MATKSKVYEAAAAKVDRDKFYTPSEAVALAKETGSKKFDSTVEVALKLSVDPRKADQMVRGTVILPHGTGKTARVIVFATGPAAELIKKAAGVPKGSGEPHKTKVAKLSADQVREIATMKMEDLNANDVEQAMKIIAGTARSMGVETELK